MAASKVPVLAQAAVEWRQQWARKGSSPPGAQDETLQKSVAPLPWRRANPPALPGRPGARQKPFGTLGAHVAALCVHWAVCAGPPCNSNCARQPARTRSGICMGKWQPARTSLAQQDALRSARRVILAATLRQGASDARKGAAARARLEHCPRTSAAPGRRQGARAGDGGGGASGPPQRSSTRVSVEYGMWEQLSPHELLRVATRLAELGACACVAPVDTATHARVRTLARAAPAAATSALHLSDARLRAPVAPRRCERRARS